MIYGFNRIVPARESHSFSWRATKDGKLDGIQLGRWHAKYFSVDATFSTVMQGSATGLIPGDFLVKSYWYNKVDVPSGATVALVVHNQDSQPRMISGFIQERFDAELGLVPL